LRDSYAGGEDAARHYTDTVRLSVQQRPLSFLQLDGERRVLHFGLSSAEAKGDSSGGDCGIIILGDVNRLESTERVNFSN
jgi:hypothetical protein